MDCFVVALPLPRNDECFGLDWITTKIRYTHFLAMTEIPPRHCEGESQICPKQSIIKVKVNLLIAHAKSLSENATIEMAKNRLEFDFNKD